MTTKIIRNPDSKDAHASWRKAQKKCGIKTGDVDPITSHNFDKRVRKTGMTKPQIVHFAVKYYKKMGMCKRK